MATMSWKSRACLEECKKAGELIRYDGGFWSRDKFSMEAKDSGSFPEFGDNSIYCLIAYGFLEVAVRSNKSKQPFVVRPKKLEN